MKHSTRGRAEERSRSAVRRAHNLQGGGRRHPSGHPRTVDGRRRLGQDRSLIHGNVPAFDGVVVVDQVADQGLPPLERPAAYTGPARHRSARRSPRRTASSRPVQRELRRRVHRLQRARRDHHEPGLHADRRDAVPRAVRVGSGFSDEVLEYRLDGKNIAEVLAMSADRGIRLLRRQGSRAHDPGAHDRRGHRLHHARPGAEHPLGRRAAAAQARDLDGEEGRDLRARRADDGPAPRRRRAACSGCWTAWWRRATASS